MSEMKDNRPLSPHVGIYRWQYTNTLSILHRITGFGLTLGLIPLTLWLWATAYDAQLFDWLSMAFHTVFGKLCLFGWTLAFYYHLGNGIRHLNWDMGQGFTLEESKASGQLVVVFAISLAIFTWAIVAHTVGI